uniref:Uncharacterized protein n=1 Tax=Arcella intermedia TaxID=1963864 RepID=A0A6B2LWS6_9EUKA
MGLCFHFERLSSVFLSSLKSNLNPPTTKGVFGTW